MRGLIFAAAPWLVAVASCARYAQYSLSSNCDLVSVESFHDITEHYHAFLDPASDRCVLFRIEDSHTFLTRKGRRRWSLETLVESLAKLSSMTYPATSHGSFKSPFFRRLSRRREEDQWLEFYYEDFVNHTVEGLTPVSLCHSEVLGEGSVVSLQSIFVNAFGKAAELTADFDFFTYAVSTAAEVALEKAKGTAVKILCAIQHGEMGQLFLANTQYIYYTPYHRVRVYDQNSNLFGEGEEYIEGPRERRILKGGVGDWVCATSSVADLKCHGLAGINSFWRAHEEPERTKWNKDGH